MKSFKLEGVAHTMEHTFQITISSCENQTWQGVLSSDMGEYHFQSELELLLEMARRVYPGEAVADAHG